MKKALSFLFMLLLCWQAGAVRRPVKVACVGNSITFGMTLPSPERDSYPAQLQRLLGDGYEVGRFGHSGSTLLYHGHNPYVRTAEFKQAMDFAGDVVVIHLGVNDTDPRDWPNYRDEFVTDYLALIDSFRVANPKCQIMIARLSPLSSRHHRFESGTRDWREEVQQAIVTVAVQSGAKLIDFHTPLYSHPNLIPDAIHPNIEGSGLLAKAVYGAVTGDYGGLRLPMPYSDNMVLQRGRNIPLHGTANAGDKVQVSVGKHRAAAVADYLGKWAVSLPELPAGGPYEMTVKTKDRTIVLHNILVGEVWLCSGQSNMEFMLKQCQTGVRDIPGSTVPGLRLLDMKARWRTDAVEWDAAALDSVNHLHYLRQGPWTECTPEAAQDFSAVAYYFGRMLQDSLKVPVGLICNAVGGSPAEAWIDRRTLEFEFPSILRNWLQNDFIQGWVRGRAAQNIKQATDKLQRHPYEPCYMYESGIMPLDSFPIKGVIWYQGESNAHNKDAHSKLFPLLVGSWRNYWSNPCMPFYFVQLSSLNRPSWPWFRDSQRRLLQRVPNSGMAVTSDVGNETDVHPRRKLEVGERLARLALHDTYGMKRVVPSGPLFREVSFTQGAAYVTFDFAEGLKTADGQAIRTFEVAETEGLFHPAEAEILPDGRVRVSSPEVKHPRLVRYGWQPYTMANLVNGAGLPASTFRSE